MTLGDFRSGISLRWRLLILIMLTSGLILCAVIFYNADFARQALEKSLKERAAETASHAAAAVDSRIRIVARAVEMAAVDNSLSRRAYLGVGGESPNRAAMRSLRQLLVTNPEIYGGTIAIDPSVDGFAEGFSPYMCRTKTDGFREENLAREDYNYAAADWYLVPRELNRPLWSEPMYDEGGGDALMVTYSVPFRFEGSKRAAADGKADGVQTGDITLEWLDALLLDLPLGTNDYAFLVSRFGTIIAHPRKDWVMSETLFSLAESFGDQKVKAWAREVLSGNSGMEQTSNLFGYSGDAWIAYEPVPSAGWTMVAVLSLDEANTQIHSLVMTEIQIGLLGLLVLLTSVVLITDTITRPLRKLTQATKQMTRGNLDAPLPPHKGGDEVADLTRSFAAMRNELKTYMANLQATAISKERLESELRIASDIQHSFLPEKLPNHPKCDLAAIFEPAREVGGDIYDVRLDEANERLYLVIGDVSGKGVPAAMFMALTCWLWRHFTRECDRPEDILRSLNKELAPDNNSCYFITMFCVVVELRTGHMRYASAGHFPQALHCANGEDVWLASELEIKPCLPLGLDGNAEYRGRSRQLNKSDLLVLFTDGVCEAENDGREQYGEESIWAPISEEGLTSAQALDRLRHSVNTHVAGAEPSDDLTLLAFRYVGDAEAVNDRAGNIVEWRPASTYSTGKMLDWLERISSGWNLTADDSSDLGLVLDEALQNSIKHGKADFARVTLRRADGEIGIEIIDDGFSFNPLSVPIPDLDVPLEERKAGGLGVYLIRRLTLRQEWKRTNGVNVFTLAKKLGG